MPTKQKKIRNLVVVLGDQLDLQSAALRGFDPQVDLVWLAEVSGEATQVWNHKARIAIFLSAMRHFRDRARAAGWPVEYRQLDDPTNSQDLASELTAAIKKHQPQQVQLVQPGEWRVQQMLTSVERQTGVPIVCLADEHFLCSGDEFAAHVQGRKQLRMEFFYREMRQRLKVLMDGDKPIGGEWNYDSENRGSFGKKGPGKKAAPQSFSPDAITREVLALVNGRFAKHPGSLEQFDWPVTPKEAQAALKDFIEHRLADFGQYQDAMWTDEPYLYHSRLAAAMNLKLLNPREVIRQAEEAYRKGKASLASVEGFIRQILGWREYVRGIYWQFMPQYLERNALKAHEPLPEFYWTGETEMNCLRQAIGQTLEYGYAHHIQRLMVTGLFSLLLGVEPVAIHEWYLAVYVDAVEWVELPNTLGMSQYADGGVMASKPYVATGKYIQRMSNYCQGCQFDPALSVGPNACPFTTLYWDFLLKHRKTLQANPRMSLQLKNLDRLDADKQAAIVQQAVDFRGNLRKKGK